MDTKILNYSDIIKNQATINIGCIGHVSEGKSTVVKMLTNIKTQKHKKEQERNITINLGYANFKIWTCPKTNELFYTSSNVLEKLHPINNNSLKLIKHVSFVDCPGHESFMSTMISGTTIMNCAFLLIGANNKNVPQIQTYEHLMALKNTSVNDILVLQNKLDLLNSKEEALLNLHKIEGFLDEYFIERPIILPISAQLGINIDKICEYVANNLNITNETLNEPLFMPIIRSFDVNKPKTVYNKLNGGVIGGSIIHGVLNVGDYIEIRPGLLTNINSIVKCTPIITKVESIYSEKNNLQYAIPGGLIGIGTGMDPYLCGSNRLVGQIVGRVGNMPNIYIELDIKIKRLKRVDLKRSSFDINERVQLCINSCIIHAYINKTGKKAHLKLDKPICCKLHQKITIFKNISGKFTLYSFGEILSGKKVDQVCYNENSNILYKHVSRINYHINYDIDYTFLNNNIDYNQLLDNFNFSKIKQTSLTLEPLIIKKKPKQTIINNMWNIFTKIHKLRDKTFNYEENFIKFLCNEINKSCRFNGKKQLIMDGKFTHVQVEKLLTNYILKYVICNACKSYNTFISKEEKLVKINCNQCTSINSIRK